MTSISSGLVFLLSVATGLAVSTIYLLQPLLQTVANSLQIALEKVGLIVTLTQAGYGLGILFLIPLGDVLPKKKLVLAKLLLLTAALCFTGLGESYSMILVGSLLVGVLASSAQDLVPLSADLANEKYRGEVVGKVMSGLLLGILLSRTVSGFIADAMGWRAVFFFSAVFIGIVSVLLAVFVKAQPAKTHVPYVELILSTLRNFSNYRSLREAIVVQGLLGLAFSAFWTNLSFFLTTPPFSMTPSQIGMFGLAGAAGALAAPIAGRISDRKGPYLGIMAGISLVLSSFILMKVFPFSVAVLAIGAVGFDLGVQMALVSHQSVIYALNPSARARLNALFISAMFGAFALGSFVSVQMFAWGGWSAVLWFCIASSGMALLVPLASGKKIQLRSHSTR